MFFHRYLKIELIFGKSFLLKVRIRCLCEVQLKWFCDIGEEFAKSILDEKFSNQGNELN